MESYDELKIIVKYDVGALKLSHTLRLRALSKPLRSIKESRCGPHMTTLRKSSNQQLNQSSDGNIPVNP